jgi:polypeptide N-acetylgalactosaminyltransferase
MRPEACGNFEYPATSSTMSVILVFYNEGTSTLLRTAQSVLDRTPPEMLAEVLLVDDGNPSNDPRVQQQMADIEAYIAEHPKVKLLKLDTHEGLIVAKNRGGQAAIGDILTFMDSHCEVGYGWAEPLVAAINEDEKTVAVPMIDAIGWEYFDYLAGELMRGIMSWSLYFTWEPLTAEHLASREPSDPLTIPIMPGGLFSISRNFFEHIGWYDDGLKIWGGENLEMSLKVWMCGGRIEILPCSRIGHIFKSVNHKFPSDHSVSKNLNRVVEVWLPEYKHIYYDAFPTAVAWGHGDVSDALAVRDRLGDECKDFTWFVKNVFPDMFVPLKKDDERSLALIKPSKANPRIDYFRRSGRLVASNVKQEISLCLDTQAHEIASVPSASAVISVPAMLESCKDVSDLQQWYHMLRSKQIVHIGLWTEFCLTGTKSGRIKYEKCLVEGSDLLPVQQWSRKSPGVIYHPATKKCITVSSDRKLRLKKCSKTSDAQRFHFEII